MNRTANWKEFIIWNVWKGNRLSLKMSAESKDAETQTQSPSLWKGCSVRCWWGQYNTWVLTLCLLLVSRSCEACSSEVLEGGGYISCRCPVLQNARGEERGDSESLWLAPGARISQVHPAKTFFPLAQLRLQWFALNALNFLNTLHPISRTI